MNVVLDYTYTWYENNFALEWHQPRKDKKEYIIKIRTRRLQFANDCRRLQQPY